VVAALPKMSAVNIDVADFPVAGRGHKMRLWT